MSVHSGRDGQSLVGKLGGREAKAPVRKETNLCIVSHSETYRPAVRNAAPRIAATRLRGKRTRDVGNLQVPHDSVA